jgi:hypothetical protein
MGLSTYEERSYRLVGDINDFPIGIRRADPPTDDLPFTTQEDDRIDEKVAMAQARETHGIVVDVPEERSAMDDGCPLLKQL